VLRFSRRLRNLLEMAERKKPAKPIYRTESPYSRTDMYAVLISLDVYYSSNAYS